MCIRDRLWESIEGEGFISNAKYPTADESKIDLDAEAGEELVQRVMEDLNNIMRVVKKTPSKIHLYVAEEWKHKVFQAIRAGKGVKDVMADPKIKQYGKQAVKLMQMRPDEIGETLPREKEVESLGKATRFLSKIYDAEFQVHETGEYDPEGKMKYALPGKPGIYLE